LLTIVTGRKDTAGETQAHMVLSRQDTRVWTGFMWPGIGNDGGNCEH